MARLLRTGDTPARRRRAHVRSCAEVLRLLAQNPALGRGHFDAEAKDQVAFLVFQLRGLHATIEASAEAWDDRDYWRKAEALRAKYRWARRAADDLAALALADRWAEVPDRLLALVPAFADVTVQQVTRNADWWCGALRALRREAADAPA